MSQPMPATPEPEPAPAYEPAYAYRARHIWLHTRRSLCDLAVQMNSPAADEFNDYATRLPACGSCIAAVDLLLGTMLGITRQSTGICPTDPKEAIDDLARTGWQWLFDRFQLRDTFTYREEYTRWPASPPSTSSCRRSSPAP